VRAGRVVRAGLLLRAWLPAILWAVVISLASTDTFSSDHTSRFILPFLHWSLPYASEETLERLHFVIRKLGHLSEYFVFGAILFRSIRSQHRGWNVKWALLAIAIAAVYSGLDEFHQSFVASRTASPWDSMLDTMGAAAAQAAAWLWFRLTDNRMGTSATRGEIRPE
jgi:VanZ family protein